MNKSKTKGKPKAETRRQHYVPQLLLRYFALRTKGADGETLCCLTKRGVRSRENIANVCVERDYYSSPGVHIDPEKVMAEREDRFAELLRTCHSQPRLKGKEAKSAAEFVSHLRLRSRAMRSFFQQVFQQLQEDSIDGFVRQAARTDRPTTPLQEDLRSIFATSTSQSCGDLGRVLNRHLSSWVLEDLIGLKNHPMMLELLQMIGPAVQSHLITVHLLNRASDASYQWRTVALKDHDLLLGDCGPLYRDNPRALFTYLFNNEGPDSAIYLPIGPDRLLVGSKSPTSPVPTVEALNQASIELSEEYVVGLWAPSRFRKEAKRLGKRTGSHKLPPELTNDARASGQAAVEMVCGIVSGMVAKRFAPLKNSVVEAKSHIHPPTSDESLPQPPEKKALPMPEIIGH
jgi:hypothetical protein